ncbi:MAG TPA: VCBS repeat-containing protein [Polyangia bacterium]
MFNYAEGIGTGDFNRDGKVDVLSGPFRWEGPTFDKRHQIFPPPPNSPYDAGTEQDWADYPTDVDGDGWVDSINIMRPGTPSYWYKNPGMPAVAADVATWEKHLIGPLIMEQSALADLAGDGKLGLVCAITSRLGWFTVGANSPWTFNDVTPMGPWGANDWPWWHGIGVADVDGDGKPDLLEANDWWSRKGAPDGGFWIKHPQSFKGDGVAEDHGPSRWPATTSMAMARRTWSRRWTLMAGVLAGGSRTAVLSLAISSSVRLAPRTPAEFRPSRRPTPYLPPTLTATGSKTSSLARRSMRTRLALATIPT